MAVELRCPECKAKLKLPVEPEPDSEIECPKCGHVFPCEENIIHAGAAGDEGKPKKKKKATGEDEKPKKKAEKDDKKDEKKEDKKDEKKGNDAAQPKKRKKKKSKKRKTKPAILAAIIVGVVMIIGTVGGVLIWFFTKKSASQEMMTYLPDECNVVVGINLGHIQKYPEFYKSCQTIMGNYGFKKAGDVFAKALGSEKIDDVVDYVVQGAGYANGNPDSRVETTVLRTKEEYDPAALAKIPGAKEYTLNGVKYYTIPDIADLGYSGVRVFGPTNRLVVFCNGGISDAKFKLMLTGNKDNLDNTVYVRSGPLGKQTIRGTIWRFSLETESGRLNATLGAGKLFPPPTAGTCAGSEDEEAKRFRSEVAPIFQNMKGIGVKASVGSREVRGEMFVWYGSSDAASSMLKTWKEKEWIKDDEKEAPKWFKTLSDKSGAGKTALNVVRDGLAFRSSGELFSVRSSCGDENPGPQRSDQRVRSAEFTRRWHARYARRPTRHAWWPTRYARRSGSSWRWHARWSRHPSHAAAIPTSRPMPASHARRPLNVAPTMRV